MQIWETYRRTEDSFGEKALNFWEIQNRRDGGVIVATQKNAVSLLAHSYSEFFLGKNFFVNKLSFCSGIIVLGEAFV